MIRMTTLERLIDAEINIAARSAVKEVFNRESKGRVEEAVKTILEKKIVFMHEAISKKIEQTVLSEKFETQIAKLITKKVGDIYEDLILRNML